ncbi:MAG: fused MFS/spermidine synthase [Hamadaea sp.]|nr:fused MFS/spermidine synthase [Hamadaea sp.]
MGDVYVIETGVVELVEDPDEPDAWTLIVNGMPQSHVNLADPVMIAFDYVRRTLRMIDLTLPEGPLRVLHLGGGALSIPRCLSLLRPGSDQTVVEIDPLLADLVAEKLPLHPDSGVHVTIGDAKEALAASPPQEYDLIIADIFTGSAVPRHVTNAQFVKLAAAALAPGGLYLANVIDGRPLIFLRRLIQAVRDEFADVVVAAEEDVFAEQTRGNFLLVGSDQDLRVLTELPAEDPYDLVVKRGKALSEFLAGELPNR